jgi:hypothetical protein
MMKLPDGGRPCRKAGVPHPHYVYGLSMPGRRCQPFAADGYHQAQGRALARLFTDGLAVARRAQDLIPILISLYDVALSSQAQGDLADASGHLKEGLATATEAGDETSAAYYLEALAAVADQQDSLQRAVRLLAAARSQLDTSGTGWLHAYVPRAPHDDTVLAALRARIGDAAYEEAWAWGGSVGSRHARQYALEDRFRGLTASSPLLSSTSPA